MCESVTEYSAADSTAAVTDRKGSAGWSGARRLEWEERLVREQPPIREAMEYCLTEPGEAETALRMTTALFLDRIARLPWEGRGGALDRRGGQATVDRVIALCADSVLAGSEGDLDDAAALVDEAGHAVADLDEVTLEALVSEAAGYLAVFGSDLRGAVYCFEDSLDSFRADGAAPPISTLLGSALVYGLLGDERWSDSRREEAFAIAQAGGEIGCRAST
ncbi:hypothetical protein [Rhodococcus daqingensis]|uniref:Uncharacterized protein n=1 Tax=Rhodococcus daqingensis TaxID=2479363 RepID=A0ABW2RSP7_9NOCA